MDCCWHGHRRCGCCCIILAIWAGRTQLYCQKVSPFISFIVGFCQVCEFNNNNNNNNKKGFSFRNWHPVLFWPIKKQTLWPFVCSVVSMTQKRQGLWWGIVRTFLWDEVECAQGFPQQVILNIIFNRTLTHLFGHTAWMEHSLTSLYILLEQNTHLCA